MSEPTYYTPELSEIHWGLEFEVHKNTGIISGQEIEWQSTQLRYGDFWQTKDNVKMEGRVRVKHLDQSDIEAEVWVFVRSEYYGGLLHFNIAYPNIPNWSLRIERDLRVQIRWHSQYASHSRFIGRIRNRSELRKVMKMLGIT